MKRMSALFLCFLLFCVLTGCASSKRAYYSNTENFLNCTGIVEHINYSSESESVYLTIRDITPADTFSDDCFKLSAQNESTIRQNGFYERVAVGDTISFVSAPRYFGDGYVMPIVALFNEEQIFLDFESGHTNLMDQL